MTRTIIAERVERRSGESVIRAQMSAAVVEEIDFAPVFGRDPDIARTEPGKRAGHLPDAVVIMVRDIEAAIRPDGDSLRNVECGCRSWASVPPKSSCGYARYRRYDAV